MLEFPSIWNITVSTLVFILAAWGIHRYLDEQGIIKGMTRGLFVFVLASVVSWGAGECVDWMLGSQPKPVASQDVTPLLKQLSDHQN